MVRPALGSCKLNCLGGSKLTTIAYNPYEIGWFKPNRLALSHCHHNTKTLRLITFYILEPVTTECQTDEEVVCSLALDRFYSHVWLPRQTDRHPGEQPSSALPEQTALGLSVSWEDGNFGRYVTFASQGLLNLPSFKIRTAFHGRKMLCSWWMLLRGHSKFYQQHRFPVCVDM